MLNIISNIGIVACQSVVSIDKSDCCVVDFRLVCVRLNKKLASILESCEEIRPTACVHSRLRISTLIEGNGGVRAAGDVVKILGIVGCVGTLHNTAANSEKVGGVINLEVNVCTAANIVLIRRFAVILRNTVKNNRIVIEICSGSKIRTDSGECTCGESAERCNFRGIQIRLNYA